LATPNYGYEKRQRELAKKQKKEEKLRAKSAAKRHNADGSPVDDGDAPDGPATEGDRAPGQTPV